MIRKSHPPAGPENLGAAGKLLSRRIFLRSGVFAGALGSTASAEPLTIPPWIRHERHRGWFAGYDHGRLQIQGRNAD